MSNEPTQPTPEQIIVARFEAVKVATAVAERVLLHDYERQVIINSCVLALQTLKQEHERLVAGDDNAEAVVADEDDEVDVPESTDGE